MNLDEASKELRVRNESVPKPLRLPAKSEVDAAEQRLGVRFSLISAGTFSKPVTVSVELLNQLPLQELRIILTYSMLPAEHGKATALHVHCFLSARTMLISIALILPVRWSSGRTADGPGRMAELRRMDRRRVVGFERGRRSLTYKPTAVRQ